MYVSCNSVARSWNYRWSENATMHCFFHVIWWTARISGKVYWR